ncbi:salicylic acid-binding protein 2-like [Hibiscus syriacus]|uniref:Salicylic acid-binding protein 2-like n=1 Tax=Hibiscus syriacus TaxID=106335 RepID=A0A6A3AI55_HIBSY|nr:salicylic acid-binding protein 2-like [Hibiscus syriacus]
MYSRCNSLSEAKKIFDKTPNRNVVSYNALISAYSRAPNHSNLAFRLVPQMGFKCLSPNGATFTSLLQAALLVEDRLIGSSLHALLVKFGFLCDVCVQIALLGMYSNCGDSESANAIFACIDGRDVVAWNSTIFGNLRNGKIKEGLAFFFDMIKFGVSPTPFTYSTVLSACGKVGNYDWGIAIHARIVVSNIVVDLPLQNALLDMYFNCEHGDDIRAMELFVKLKGIPFLKPDEYTFASVISATSALLASDYGKPLHGQVTKSGMESSVFVGTTLVSMYFKNSDSESAEAAFSMILKKDVVLWTEMIMGYSRMADGAIKSGCKVEMSVCGSLINMYAKNGNLQAATSIFSLLSYPDLKSWNAILGAYSLHGMAEDAMKLFDDILKHELKPDQVTFLSLLSACNHSGLVKRGKFFWAYMKENGCTAGPKHYSCMVSLLCRAELLDDAEKMIKDSPYSEERLELWRTLLSSGLTFRNLEKGVHAGGSNSNG